MSSHREAPEISKDPVADNTDIYAFVSPDRPDTVTLIANYIPLEDPAGGPNFFEFGDDVLLPDQRRQRRRRPGRRHLRVPASTRRSGNPNTFLYNTGPIASLDSANCNRRSSTASPRIATASGTSEARQEPALPAVQHRPAVDPELRRPGERRDLRRSTAASRCSPGSGSTASTSTSGRSSTWPRCGRSRTCT